MRGIAIAGRSLGRPAIAPWGAGHRLAGVTMVLGLAFGCGGAGEAPIPWTIPVPEGATVIEYAAVAAEERTGRIELLEELVIAPSADGPDSLFRPRALAADDAGRLYVADLGHHSVKVFDATGAHVRNFGRYGQGPGEFQGPLWIAVDGSRVVVGEPGKLSFWDHEGNYLEESTSIGGELMDLIDLGPNGEVVAKYLARDDTGRQLSAFARRDSGGNELASYVRARDPTPIWYPDRAAEGRLGLAVGVTAPMAATGSDGTVYVTQSDEYQILSFLPDGEPRWALRMALPRPSLGRPEIDRVIERVRSRFPNTPEGAIGLPASSYALSRIWVDGHDHLYVFPYVVAGLEPDELPVDVYSADGERLFAGFMPSTVALWDGTFALGGDYVYDLRDSAATGEHEIARLRLVEPFAGPE